MSEIFDKKVITKPSYWASFMQGILFLVFLWIIIISWKEVSKMELYKIIVILLLLAIGIGIHSLSHLGLEYVYHWNVLEKKAT